MENSKLYIEHVIELLHAIANEQDVYVQQASDLLVETIKQQHSIYFWGISCRYFGTGNVLSYRRSGSGKSYFTKRSHARCTADHSDIANGTLGWIW